MFLHPFAIATLRMYDIEKAVEHGGSESAHPKSDTKKKSVGVVGCVTNSVDHKYRLR